MNRDFFKELLSKNRLEKGVKLLNDSLKRFIENNSDFTDLDIVKNIQNALIVNSSLLEQIKYKELNVLNDESDEILLNKVRKNFITIIEELPVEFWESNEKEPGDNGLEINLTILSAFHYHNEENLVSYIKRKKGIKINHIERYSLPDLNHSNLILIDTEYRDSSNSTKEFIESIRKFHSKIVLILSESKESLNNFIFETGDRFKHYYQLVESEDGETTQQNFDSILRKCAVEIKKNYKA